MFELCSTRAEQIVQMPGGVPLSDQYPYLRLFLGRFLPDVRVQSDGKGFLCEWVIHEGTADRPSESRVVWELQELFRTLSEAQAEINGPVAVGAVSQGQRAGRAELASRVLSAVRLPTSAEDVIFTRDGDLVMLNWCVARSGSEPKLGDCRLDVLGERLATALRVPETRKAALLKVLKRGNGTPMTAASFRADSARGRRKGTARSSRTRMAIAGVLGVALGFCGALAAARWIPRAQQGPSADVPLPPVFSEGGEDDRAMVFHFAPVEGGQTLEEVTVWRRLSGQPESGMRPFPRPGRNEPSSNERWWLVWSGEYTEPTFDTRIRKVGEGPETNLPRLGVRARDLIQIPGPKIFRSPFEEDGSLPDKRIAAVWHFIDPYELPYRLDAQ